MQRMRRISCVSSSLVPLLPPSRAFFPNTCSTLIVPSRSGASAAILRVGLSYCTSSKASADDTDKKHSDKNTEEKRGKEGEEGEDEDDYKSDSESDEEGEDYDEEGDEEEDEEERHDIVRPLPNLKATPALKQRLRGDRVDPAWNTYHDLL